MFGKILVPLDGSRLALRVLEPLERLVTTTATELTLLRVVTPHGPVEYDRLPAVEFAMQLQLTRIRERLCLGTRMRLQLVRGEDPAEEIVRYAQETGQELVAMSTHGRTGVERLLRGSVAEEVLRTCDLPLLLCNPHAFGGGEDARFERILVALDGTERSERVLPVVERIATAHRSHVSALHVEPASSHATVGAASDVGGAAERLQAHGIAADACTSHGDVVAQLLEAAADVDLLAMATHGRSGLPRWWFGSVTEEVLRHARCPLLVVRTG